MDDELARLNGSLASTLVPYGAAEEQVELLDKRDRAVAASPSAAASRLGFLSKLGGMANTGRADLLDAIASGDKKLAEVPESELPPELAAMAPAKREAFVKEKLEERKRIQTRIDALAVERDAYVAQETARRAAEGKDDGFDITVEEAVRLQALAYGISY